MTGNLTINTNEVLQTETNFAARLATVTLGSSKLEIVDSLWQYSYEAHFAF